MWLGGTLKQQKKKKLKRLSSSNVMIGYLCVQRLSEWA